jgi:protein involved in polysaccharide export with SLBB domain
VLLGKSAPARRFTCLCFLFLLGPLLTLSTGCSSLLFKIKGIPASEIPDNLRPVTRNDRIPIDYRLLGQVPPDVYRIDAGDVLGIAVEGIFPFSPPTAPPVALPVNFPGQGNPMPPSTGFPVVVQQDGTIQLPGIDPFSVRQMSVEEIRQAIADAYRKARVIRDEKVFPIVSLIKTRTYNVSVIRQDLGMGSQSVQLDAYRNDVLHALLKTGGLPGEKAKDQVTILRYSSLTSPAIPTPEALPPQASSISGNTYFWDTAYTIPLTLPIGSATAPISSATLPIGSTMNYPWGGSLLNEGDILYIENRETEVFYTAGMIPAAQHLLPRDYDIDIFEAMSIAGYSFGSGSQAGGNIVGITGVSPTRLYIFRKGPDGREVVIQVDLEKAVCDPRERLIIMAGDKLLLRYSPKEEIANFGIISFFTYGFQQFFRND